MKRFYILIIVTLIMCAYGYNPNYLLKYADSINAQVILCSTINNQSNFIHCPIGLAYKTKSSLKNITGQSFIINGNKKLFDIIIQDFDVKVINKYYSNNILIIEGVSPNLVNGIRINNKHINIQLAYKDNTITVGYPLITIGY